MEDEAAGPGARAAQYVLISIVAALSTSAIVGIATGNTALAGRIARYDAMVPMAALTFLALCAALLVRIVGPSWSRPAVRWVAAIVLAVSALEFVDWLTGLPVAPDRLFATAADLLEGRQSGRMSPVVAASFAALAVSLLLSWAVSPRGRSTAAALALIVANLGFVLCVGYAYNAPLLYETAPLPPALPAAIGMMLLGLGIAVLMRDRRPLSLFVGDSVRAQLMRAVFPVIVLTTAAFAALDIAYHRLGLAQTPLLTSLIFIGAVTAVSVTVLRSASSIGKRVDRADTALTESNEALGRMVHDVATTMGRVVEARDPYTQGHEQRVAALAARIARRMGLSDDEVDGVEMAGLLHDIGKLRVPAEILTKPGRLSAAEFALIREHPEAGFEILKAIEFPWPIAEIVYQHHERLDASGYPRGLAGADILPAARILAVADVVEAMATDRPYRPALGLDAALAELHGSPDKYDAAAVAACTQLYESGETGL